MPEATQPIPATQPHRNHGLFSDHYLDVTLPQRPGWEELIERARPVMEEISSVFGSFTPSANEAQTERDLVRPVLKILDHHLRCGNSLVGARISELQLAGITDYFRRSVLEDLDRSDITV